MFVAGDVGAYLFLKTGTNSLPGWYKIASVSAGLATLSAAAGTVSLWDSNSKGASSVNTLTGCGTTSTLSSCTGMIDYSQQGSAFAAYTNLVGIGSVTMTSITANFHQMLIGNGVQLVSATGGAVTAGFYTITTYTSATSVSIDRSAGTYTGGTGSIGGAHSAPRTVLQAMVAGNDCYILYNASAFTGWTTAAAISVGADGTTDRQLRVMGYSAASERNPTSVPANRPTIKTGISNAFFSTLTAGFVFQSLIFDASNSGVGISSSNAFGLFWNCKAINIASGGPAFSQAGFECVFCEVDSTGGSGYLGVTVAVFCQWTSTGTGGTGFSGCNAIWCIAQGVNITAGIGFAPTNSQAVSNCVAYNVQFGFESSSVGSRPAIFINCLAHTCGTGYQSTGVSQSMNTRLMCCAYYSAGSPPINTNWYGIMVYGSGLTLSGLIQCTSDPCNGAASGDFTLNNTAGGGAVLRAAGFGSFPGLSTSGANGLDVGAYQHASSGSGPTGFPMHMGGIM